MSEVNPSISLRGRAIDVLVRTPDGGSEETVGIMFDCNVLADLEIRYDSPIDVPLTEDVEVPELDADMHPVVVDGVPKMKEVTRPVVDAIGNTLMTPVEGVMRWQVEMERKPYATLRTTVAIALGITDRDAGQRMMPEHLGDYLVAVGTAFAIANGVDPTQAFQKAQDEMGELQRKLNAAVEGETVNVDNHETSDTRGSLGLQHGPTPDSL